MHQPHNYFFSVSVALVRCLTVEVRGVCLCFAGWLPVLAHQSCAPVVLGSLLGFGFVILYPEKIKMNQSPPPLRKK